MVAGFSAPSAVCEDQSTAWANEQANYAPIVSANATGTAVAARSATSGSGSSKHARAHQKQNEVQNSLNSSAKTQEWPAHVDAQAAVSFNSLMWNGTSETAEPSARKPSSSSSSSSHHRQSSKQEKASKKNLRDAPAAAKRDGSLFQRIADWDLNTVTLSSSVSDSCRLDAQAITAATTTTGDSTSSNSSSGNSSPALSASGESKQSSSPPDSPSLGEDVTVKASEKEEVSAVSAAGVLLHTLAESPSLTCTQALTLSYVTPCASFTGSSSTASSPSPTPSTPASNFNMADIATALRHSPESQHPFLDMQYQRNLREHERVQEQLNAQVVHSFQNQFSPPQQAAAFKSLLNAAHQRQYWQCMSRDMSEEKVERNAQRGVAATSAEDSCGARAPSSVGRWGPRQRRLINRQWRMTAEQAECDLYREGLGSVQRKLSCMCLFNPDTDVRVYDENSSMREQRCYRQHKLLVRLQRQRVRGGNPYFLDEAQ